MAIQKSVLNNVIISELLQTLYNMPTDNIEKLGIGTANCYKIHAEGKRYFLKEYQETFSKSDLQREIQLNEFLLSASYPTAAFISDVNGNKYIYTNNRYIVLQEYIDGKSYITHNLPDKILFQAAELLGRLHEILEGYEMPVEMDKPWVEKFNVEKAISSYDLLIEHTTEIKDKTIRDKIRADLLFKKELLNITAPYVKYFDKITYKSTHGDYTAMQYLCIDDEIKAVIDFASARKIPASWEIMRSYMQSAIDTKIPADFDMNKFCDYVRHYLSVSTLSEDDLKYMPFIYLYQLARSKYGYKEYMLNVENKEALLEFAFWRTDICRMLADKADEISQMLIHYNYEKK